MRERLGSARVCAAGAVRGKCGGHQLRTVGSRVVKGTSAEARAAAKEALAFQAAVRAHRRAQSVIPGVDVCCSERRGATAQASLRSSSGRWLGCGG